MKRINWFNVCIGLSIPTFAACSLVHKYWSCLFILPFIFCCIMSFITSKK